MKRKQKDAHTKILNSSKKYANVVPEKSNTVEEVAKINPESKKRKATAADKERKRNKRKLKRLKELGKKHNQNKDNENLNKAMSLALSYLREWHTEKSNWAFKKKRQHWLLSHIYSLEVPDEDFNILLDYIVSLQGVAKERLISDSEKVIQNYESKNWEIEEEDSEDNSIRETENHIFERAKSVLQILV